MGEFHESRGLWSNHEFGKDECITFTGVLKDGMFIDGAYRQPTFLYESLLNIIGFFIIVFLVNKFLKKDGSQFAFYFIWYGIVRFIVEAYRSDSLMLGVSKWHNLPQLSLSLRGL